MALLKEQGVRPSLFEEELSVDALYPSAAAKQHVVILAFRRDVSLDPGCKINVRVDGAGKKIKQKENTNACKINFYLAAEYK